MSAETEHIERLAKVERSVEIIERTVTKMDGKLDTWQANYAPRNELNEMFKSRDVEIKDLKDKTEKQDGHIVWLWRTWIGAGLVAFVGGIVGLFFWVVKGGSP